MNEPKTQDDLIQELKELCLRVGGQHEAARQLGVSNQLINDLLRGRRDFSAKILKPMGYEKQVRYVRKEQ